MHTTYTHKGPGTLCDTGVQPLVMCTLLIRTLLIRTLLIQERKHVEAFSKGEGAGGYVGTCSERDTETQRQRKRKAGGYGGTCSERDRAPGYGGTPVHAAPVGVEEEEEVGGGREEEAGAAREPPHLRPQLGGSEPESKGDRKGEMGLMGPKTAPRRGGPSSGGAAEGGAGAWEGGGGCKCFQRMCGQVW